MSQQARQGKIAFSGYPGEVSQLSFLCWSSNSTATTITHDSLEGVHDHVVDRLVALVRHLPELQEEQGRLEQTVQEQRTERSENVRMRTRFKWNWLSTLTGRSLTRKVCRLSGGRECLRAGFESN